MPSDTESRIIRLEQLLPVIRRRIVNLRALNGQNLQNFNAIRASDDFTNPNPTITTDPTCGVDILTFMNLTDSEYGVWNLQYLPRGAGLVTPRAEAGYTSTLSGGWQECRVITAFNGNSSPIMYTVFQPTASFPSAWTMYMDWLADGLGHPDTGACGTFNRPVVSAPSRAIPTCGPFQASFAVGSAAHNPGATAVFAAP